MSKPILLVISSRSAFQRDLMDCLRSAGYRVWWATGRDRALHLMYEIHPDLLLLVEADHIGDSWKVLEQVRLYTDIPILLIAARFTEMDFEQGASLGVVSYLTYPGLMPAAAAKDHAQDLLPVVAATNEKLPQRSKGERSPAVSSQQLKRSHLSYLDRVLSDQDVSEVWLIKKEGRVRYIAELKDRQLKAEQV